MEWLSEIGWNEELFNAMKELLIVLGIGLLLGVEREFSKNKPDDEKLFAGVRTFPIVAIAGYLCLRMSEQFGMWIFAAGFLGVITLIALAYQSSRKKSRGTTTEFSLIMAFLLGGLVFGGEYHLAVTAAVVITALLSLKVRMHQAVYRLSRDEIQSIIIFIIITALVLPLLPDKDFGPYQAINLFKIWLIVSIFVTLNFLTYFLAKFMGEKKSVLSTGIIGGFASSTATAWFFSRQSRKQAHGGVLQAAAIVLASSIMFPRLLIWLLILNRSLFAELWLPVVLLGAIGVGAGLWIIRRHKGGEKEETDESEAHNTSNPINLKEALVFAAIYLAIQLLVGYAHEHFGDSGTYIAAGISGLTDIDAITISMANFEKSAIGLTVAGTAVIIAALANTLVKYGFCLVFGNARLKKYSSLAFAPLFVAGIGYIIFRVLA